MYPAHRGQPAAAARQEAEWPTAGRRGHGGHGVAPAAANHLRRLVVLESALAPEDDAPHRIQVGSAHDELLIAQDRAS